MTSCHRCPSGKLLNGGIPANALPVLIFQNSVPSLCAWTSDAVRSGAFAVPRPASP
jgi:hypothetical protein